MTLTTADVSVVLPVGGPHAALERCLESIAMFDPPPGEVVVVLDGVETELPPAAEATHSPREWHPFTIASPPGEDELRLAVKASGDFTSHLVANVAVGDQLRVDGSYGLFVQDATQSAEQVWIAGGIGVTPFLSLAPALASNDKKAKLFWSVRSDSDAPFSEELTRLAETLKGFDYELWLSHERGYLSFEAAGGSMEFSGKDVFVCGPTALRDGLEAGLKTVGTSPRRVHSEEFAFR